jgi:phosphatidylserine decarboxylase
MKKYIAAWVSLLPQNSISRAFGWVAGRRNPKLVVKAGTWLMPHLFGIDLKEADIPEGGYTSMDQLFTRQLKHGARRIDPDEKSIISPVDGTQGPLGPIEKDTAIQAKGISYTIGRLLDSENDGEAFEDGFFSTYYLSPRDYHRIHSPVAGQVVRSVYIPGGLLPVFKESTELHADLFVRNERLISYVQTKTGMVAVVKIGATAVGKISLSSKMIWK